jgi:hypothetical protein
MTVADRLWGERTATVMAALGECGVPGADPLLVERLQAKLAEKWQYLFIEVPSHAFSCLRRSRVIDKPIFEIRAEGQRGGLDKLAAEDRSLALRDFVPGLLLRRYTDGLADPPALAG